MRENKPADRRTVNQAAAGDAVGKPHLLGQIRVKEGVVNLTDKPGRLRDLKRTAKLPERAACHLHLEAVIALLNDLVGDARSAVVLDRLLDNLFIAAAAGGVERKVHPYLSVGKKDDAHDLVGRFLPELFFQLDVAVKIQGAGVHHILGEPRGEPLLERRQSSLAVLDEPQRVGYVALKQMPQKRYPDL